MEDNEIIRYLKEIKVTIEDHDHSLDVIQKEVIKTNKEIPDLKQNIEDVREEVSQNGTNVKNNKELIMDLEVRVINLERISQIRR